MIIALCGQKGGSGKSTIAILIAAELAARGQRVLLVDADPQGTARTWGESAGKDGPTVIAMAAGFHRAEQLPRLAMGYEHVVIDTAPRLGDVQRSALVVSDVALLPCGPSAPDAWALAESIRLVEEALIHRPRLVTGIVVNRKRTGTAAARTARAAFEATGFHVLAAELALRQPFAEAIAAGLGVGAYAPRDTATIELRALVDEALSMGSTVQEKEKHT